MKPFFASTIFAMLSTLLFSAYSYAGNNNGIISVKSRYNIVHTVDRLKTVSIKKGMHIFADINHAKGAKNVGIEIPPTELIIVGNPKVGSPLILCARSIAIDLPQKLLVWQDRAKQVWISYNDPVYIADRHSVNKECHESLSEIANALASLSKLAAGSE